MDGVRLTVLLGLCVFCFLVSTTSEHDAGGKILEQKLLKVSVSEVRIIAEVKSPHTQDAAGNAVVGALAGGMVGYPVAGAIVGASTTDDPQNVVAVTNLKGCKIILFAEGKRIEFILDVYEADLTACSLLRKGDPIYIEKDVRKLNGTHYWWRSHEGLVF